jgi:hypothetical protein
LLTTLLLLLLLLLFLLLLLLLLLLLQFCFACQYLPWQQKVNLHHTQTHKPYGTLLLPRNPCK